MEVTLLKQKNTISRNTIIASSRVPKPKNTCDAIAPLSNEQLWEQLHLGLQKGLEQLYKNNYQVLYSYANKICKDKELSKDCVQELFVGLWEKHAKLNEVAGVRSYLLQSIWHLVIKKLKKQNKNVSLDENGSYNTDVVFSNENIIIDQQRGKERKAKLDDAVQKLSTRQRQIIFMLYYEGLTIEEIQEITSLKYQSIKNLTHRAMLALRASYNLK